MQKQRQEPRWSNPLAPRVSRNIALSVCLLSATACSNQRDASDPAAAREEERAEDRRDPAALRQVEFTLDTLQALYSRPDAPLLLQDEGELAERDTYQLPLGEHAGECLDVLALSSGEDIDLALFSPDGQAIARDDSPDYYPILIDACLPPEGVSTLVLRNRGTSRTGYELRVLDGTRSIAPEEQGAEEHTDDDGTPPASLRELVARGGLTRMQPQGSVQRWTLYENERVTFPVAMRAGRCYAIAAMASEPGLTDLDITIENQTGERLALEAATDAQPVLGPWCPEGTDIYHIGFRAYEGGGSFTWQVLGRSEQPRAFEAPTEEADAGQDDGGSAQP